MPGAPHDYITGLNEMVNPANGSLSIRVKQPVPTERGTNWPKYAFIYDSNQQYTITPWWITVQRNNAPFTELDSYTYSFAPQYPYTNTNMSTQIQTGYNTYVTYSCLLYSGYLFTDPDGGKHGLGLSVHIPTTHNTGDDCTVFGVGDNYLVGGDEQYKASVSATGGSATVVDLHGNNPGVEDTNGNYRNSTGRTQSVPALFTTQTQTLTIPSKTFTATPQNDVDGACLFVNLQPTPKSVTVVKSVTLPNNQQYIFQYDTTYGLINKITYPTGATVTYTWSTISKPEGVQYETWPGGNGGLCALRHDWFAITKRVVTLDGVNPVEQQDFLYTTTWPAQQGYQWTSKNTTVTTTDFKTNTSFQTVYSYSPMSPPREQWAWWEDVGYVPVESALAYKDTDGSLLKTISKVWFTPNLMTAECETLPNGQTSGKFYSYQGYAGFDPQVTVNGLSKLTNLPTDVSEYDYGTVSSSCTKPTSLPVRETVTNYQSFGNTPLFGYSSILDRPSSVLVYGVVNGAKTLLQETDYVYDENTPSSVTASGHDDANYGSGSVPRGNPTTVNKRCFVGATNCTNSVTKYTYDTTGQALTIRDANLNTTTYSYADSYTTDDGSPTTSTNAYVTQITQPTTGGMSHITKFKYGFLDGKMRTKTDENNNVTTFCYLTGGCGGAGFDPFFRLTGASYPDSGQATVTYNDSGPSPTVTSSSKLNSSGSWITRVTVSDSLARPTQTQLTTDPQGTTYTATSYDGLGRPYQVWNPTRCNPPTTNCGEATWGITQYTYDALGRAKVVLEPDGSQVSTSYLNNQSTVTDEVGNQRTSQSDALGRLTIVWEAPGVQNYNYETDYAYDGVDNLLSVTQKGGDTNSSHWRTRAFTYDSLGRLLTAVNPESGTITYSYDANENLKKKTSPAPNQPSGTGTQTISYCYDTLNRLLGKAYNNSGCPLVTPAATYSYDQTSFGGLTISNGIGRRTGMSDGSGASAWSYDVMGRVAAVRRQINGISKTATYTYPPYLNGELAALTHFNGAQLSFTWGGADRLLNTTDPAANYAQQATYSPAGSLAGAVIGANNTGFTGTVVSNAYNNRLQPAVLSAASPTMTLFSLSYNFNQGTPTAPKDNGSVVSIQNNRDNTRTQAFTYDPLNRIASAQTSQSNLWGNTYVIDAWGNLTNKNAITNKGGENLQTSALTNNELSGFPYDIAGNMLDSGSNPVVYDAEDRIISAGGLSYLYDGDGNRVEKCTAGPTAGTCATGATGTLYWRGKDPDTLNESDLGAGAWKRFTYFNGKMIARRDSATGALYYFYSDYLGSIGVTTDALGQTIVNESDYYPYGGERVITSALPDEHYKFTGKERDAESNLDYFGARYYGSTIGRFMSPDWSEDPEPDPYAELLNPQSLNLYSYVQNNPLSNTDEDGHECHGEWHDNQYVIVCTAIDKPTQPPSAPPPPPTDPCGYLCQQVFHTQQSQRTWDLSARVTNKYIANPLLTFLSLAVPGALEAAGPSVEASLGTAIVSGATKAEAKQAVEGAAMTAAQKASVKRAIAKATTKFTVSVERLADGSVRVLLKRPGANGFQVISKIVSTEGKSATVQIGVEASGEISHYDPK